MEGEREIWSIETGKIILPSGEEKVIEEEITADEIKRTAREYGIKKFTVEDEQGNTLTTGDFPRTGIVYIKEYNEAK